MQWQEQDYRTINTDLQSLQSTVSSLELQGTFLTKQVTSSSSAVTATAGTTALNTSHTVDVTSVATNAVLASTAAITAITDADTSLGSLLGSNLTTDSNGDADFSISDGTNAQQFSVSGSDTLNDVINEINNSGLDVQASWDSNLQRLYLTDTQTGQTVTAQDTGGNLMQQLLDPTSDAPAGSYTNSASGTDAAVNVDGTNYSFNSNQFTINGVSYTVQGTTTSNTSQGTIDNPAIVTVTNNVSSAVSTIQSFVTDYNNTLTDLNNMLTQQAYSGYPPLTQDLINAKSLDSTEIDAWNTKAQSGLLNSDPLLQGVVDDMQDTMINPVSGLSGQVTITNDDSQQMTITCNQMGAVGLTSDFGTLSLDTDTLTQALESNPQAVISLFTNQLNSDGSLITDSNQQGLAVRLYNTLNNSISQITNQAGSSSEAVDNSYLGQEISSDNTQISNWNTQLSDLENQYYTQFNAMEQTLSEMNTQSEWLSQVFSSSSSS